MRLPHLVALLSLAACDDRVETPAPAPPAPVTEESVRADVRREIDLLGEERGDDQFRFRWLKPASANLATRYGGGISTFLAAIARVAATNEEQHLAILTLSQLAADASAREALLQLIKLLQGFPAEAALASLGYIDVETARSLAVQLLPERKLWLWDEVFALACLVGNGTERDSLRRALLLTPQHARRPDDGWWTIYNHRLTLDPTEQSRWRRCGMVYWRARIEAPPFENASSIFSHAAHTIAREVPDMPPGLVDLRLRSRDPVAALLTGLYRFDGAVDRLAALVPTMGYPAILALALVKTVEAKKGLESCLSPQHTERLNVDILFMLVHNTGDAATVRLLERLAGDVQYDDAMRKRFKEGAEELQKRLGR